MPNSPTLFERIYADLTRGPRVLREYQLNFLSGDCFVERLQSGNYLIRNVPGYVLEERSLQTRMLPAVEVTGMCIPDMDCEALEYNLPLKLPQQNWITFFEYLPSQYEDYAGFTLPSLALWCSLLSTAYQCRDFPDAHAFLNSVRNDLRLFTMPVATDSKVGVFIAEICSSFAGLLTLTPLDSKSC